MPDAAIEHIVKTPGTCGGKPRIAGSRIKVSMIAEWHERAGMTVDEILEQCPHLTKAGIHSALAYYHDHREEIDAQIRQEEALVEAVMAKSTSLLGEKLASRRH